MRTELLFRSPEAVRDVEVKFIKPRRCGSAFEQLVVFQSRKNNVCLRMSPHLLDFCLLLERKHDILFYETTPYTLVQPSQQFRYTPAVCAYGESLGLVFFDIGHFMLDSDEDPRVRHENWFWEMGYQFRSYQTYVDINNCERMQWRYLYSYSFNFKAEGDSIALDVLNDRQVRTVQQLLDAGASFGDIAFQLFHSLATADMRFPITRQTLVSLSGAGI